MVSSGDRENKGAKTTQHITPIINQKKIVASHRNIMKDNVKKFIKDHNLGQRHFGRDVASHTTAMDSDVNISNLNSR